MRQLMKPFVIVSVLAVALTVIALIFLSRAPSSEKGVILLGNFPDKVCPTAARAVFLSNEKESVGLEADQTIVVDSCRQIDLNNLLRSSKLPIDIIIKLPNALAKQISIHSIDGNYQLSVNYGDVNNDNVIDNSDEDAILAELKHPTGSSDNNSLDTNLDEKVDVLDLNIVQRNYGVGVLHPKNGKWAEDVS